MTACLQSASNSVLLASRDAADIAGVFDDGHLESETKAEVRHFIFAGVADAFDLAFGAAHAESAGDDDAVAIVQPADDVRWRRWCVVSIHLKLTFTPR